MFKRFFNSIDNFINKLGESVNELVVQSREYTKQLEEEQSNERKKEDKSIKPLPIKKYYKEASPQEEKALYIGLGHGSIGAIAVTPDRKYIVSGSTDYTIKLS